MKNIIEVEIFVEFVSEKISDKVGDHCHLNDKHRRLAHIK